MPAYQERIRSRKKVKGLPDLGQIVPTMYDGLYRDQRYKDISTPFRLPRLYGSEPSRTESAASYNQTEFLAPTPDPTIYTQTAEYLRMTGSPLKVPIKASFDYPRINHAIIAPRAAVTFSRSGRPRVRRFQQPLMLQSDHVRPQTALSNAGSIHWALGTSKSVNFDQTGQSRQQGPFSRVFTKTCMAPHNWVRMKYGRTHTVSY